MKHYIFDREKDDFMRDDDGEKVFLNSSEDVYNFLNGPCQLKDDWIESNFYIMKSCKILTVDNSEYSPTPAPNGDAVGWISIDAEKKPELGVPATVYDPTAVVKIFTAFYLPLPTTERPAVFFDGGVPLFNVTHWRPLPSPPGQPAPRMFSVEEAVKVWDAARKYGKNEVKEFYGEGISEVPDKQTYFQSLGIDINNYKK